MPTSRPSRRSGAPLSRVRPPYLYLYLTSALIGRNKATGAIVYVNPHRSLSLDPRTAAASPRATGCLAGAFHAKARGATVRRHLIAVPARASRHRRDHLTLHLPKRWRWQSAWTNAFIATHDPPPARTA